MALLAEGQCSARENEPSVITLFSSCAASLLCYACVAAFVIILTYWKPGAWFLLLSFPTTTCCTKCSGFWPCRPSLKNILSFGVYLVALFTYIEVYCIYFYQSFSSCLCHVAALCCVGTSNGPLCETDILVSTATRKWPHKFHVFCALLASHGSWMRHGLQQPKCPRCVLARQCPLDISEPGILLAHLAWTLAWFWV